MTNAPPSHQASSEDSMAGLIFETYKKFLQSTADMLPARVVSYDRSTNRARVQPLIMMLTTNGERVTRQGVTSVPVFQMGGGGFMIGFNLVEGDLGWIKANDRDISLFLQAYSEAEPNTKRLHSFNDAMFFPDIMTGYTIAGEDAGNLVIQNDDGTVKIALWPNKIKITAPLVELIAGDVIISGNLEVGSNLEVGGTALVDGMITTNTDVTAGAIVLTTHLHVGVTAGGDSTGEPTP